MRKIIAMSAAVLALAACTLEPERSATTMSDADIEVLAIEITWMDAQGDVCPLLDDLLFMGVPSRDVYDMAVVAFREGYPELTAAGERRLRELMRGC